MPVLGSQDLDPDRRLEPKQIGHPGPGSLGALGDPAGDLLVAGGDAHREVEAGQFLNHRDRFIGLIRRPGSSNRVKAGMWEESSSGDKHHSLTISSGE